MKNKWILAGLLSVVIACTGCGADKDMDTTENVTGAETTADVPESENISEESNADERYVVEDQEYVYSVYSDIGQLGEEGYYFSSEFPIEGQKEVIVYETTADITHDNVEDLVQLVIYTDDDELTTTQLLESNNSVSYVKVFRGITESSYEDYPRFISRSYSAAHAGNGTICVTKKDGQDYLLLSTIYEIQGFATYDYAAIYVDDEKGIVVEDSFGVEFAVDEGQNEIYEGELHRADVVPEFQAKIEPWLEKAVMLVSLNVDSELYFSSPEQECSATEFFDTVWERNW